MFCPHFKAEYREGIEICGNCNERLVHELQPDHAPMSAPEFIEYELVLATYNVADIAIIKSLLDAEGITYFFKGEHLLHLFPLAEPARLMVKKDEVEDAKTILQDADLSFRGLTMEVKTGESEEE